jgi:cytochrome b561
MSITRTDGNYSALAKIFHWVTVPLLVGALATGFVIGHIADPSKLGFYAIHESLGLTMLFVAIARVAWRGFNPPPPAPAGVPALMQLAGNLTHALLYAALILQPILGFLTTNAFGFPQAGATAYLGFIDLPKFMEASEGLAKVLLTLHSIVGWSLLVLIPMHVAAAIFHHAIRRDGTLLRMI